MVMRRRSGPGEPAPTGAFRRLVQLPRDAEPAPLSALDPASSARVRLTLSKPARQSELLGALVALLHRHTQQATISLDVLVGNGSEERRVALDVDVAGDAPFSSIEAAVAHPAPDGRAPSNVAVTFTPRLSGGAPARASYDVHFVFAEAHDAPLLTVAYDTKIIRSSTLHRLIEHYAVLLAAALDEPTTAIDGLPLLTPEERRALTIAQDGGPAPYVRVPVLRLFEALAKQQPQAVAVEFQGRPLTYAELDERSSRLAHHLITCGVGPEIPVAVCVRPSLDVPVAMLAIWKARGIYFPLDPTHPEALLGRMLDEARPRLVLTSSELSGLTARFPQLCLDTDAGRLDDQPNIAPAIEPNLEDAAYLFYTSGTTGKPKGVVATQGNIAHYILSAAHKYGFRADDVFASLARTTFSISLFELLSPLCCGGSLRILDRDEVLTPERLCRALAEVTVVHAGPSLLDSLFRHLRSTPSAPRALPRMRHASSGGDMVSPSVMEEMKRVFPNAELFVIYGCTEIGCMGTTFPIPREAKASRTFVGRAFPDVAVRVLDSRRNLVPFGVVGEICFAGEGVVRGYLDRPELTAERFVEIDGRRFYRTGDMGRLHPDGNLEILGRRDFQVQLRGIRIELAGIEKTVQDLGLAAQCAVVARTVDEGDVRLVAFVVKPSCDGIASFRAALAAELPDYMIPHHVMVLPAMPLTANGKLDRSRLNEMPLDTPLGTKGRTPPASERERTIAAIFARVLGLGLDDIGVDDSFFDLGGYSLLGVVALEEIERALGIAIPPHVLFEKGTVRALAAHPPTRIGGSGEPRPILLNAMISGPPLFMLSGVQIYRELARRLDGRCSAYGVFTRREVEAFDPASGSHGVEDLARDYLAIIRRQEPRGPYRLLGYSFAGIVAYEVAQQLRAAGEEVRFLGIVDAQLPEWVFPWRYRLDQLARLPRADGRAVLAFASRRLRSWSGQRRPDLAPYHRDDRRSLLGDRRDAVNRNAAEHYMSRIRPFPGAVTLFTSGERLREDPLKSPSCGWSRYVSALDVHAIDADHYRMLSDEPYVSQVAEILVKRIQQAEAPVSKASFRVT
jgi:amino acid adenylation domain-containing protein